MTDEVNRFYNSIEDANGLNQSNLIELFVYFLTVEIGQDLATSKQVNDCFEACDLVVPKNVASRLSEGLKTSPARYVKAKGGYRLQRRLREALSEKLGTERVSVQTSTTLRGLEHKVPDGNAKDFLRETIDCYEVGANRATIIMAWILAIEHLFEHILNHKLVDFNNALARDKGVKLVSIAQRDDFTELRESKFIEICRAARIISNDIRKILDTCLGVRNSCAHPSGIAVTNMKVIAFVEDLVENVVLKYKP